MRLEDGSHVVANLQRADTSSFRRGKLGEDGSFQAVSKTGGLRGWLVARMESGRYGEHSWQGRAIKTLVGGEENFRSIQSALQENRQSSLANASRLLLDAATIPVDGAERHGMEGELAGKLLDIVRSRASATAKFETIQNSVRDFSNARQARREQGENLRRLEAEAGRQAQSAVETRQPAPSGSSPRTKDTPHKTAKVIGGLPEKLDFAWHFGGVSGPFPALNTEINTHLEGFHGALKTSVSSQTDVQRAKTAAALNARLDELEEKITSARAGLEGAGVEVLAGVGAGEALRELRGLQRQLDGQRALIVDVANNFGAGHAGTAGHPVSWRAALQLRRLGLNVGARVATGASQGKEVASSIELGEGNFNKVYKVTFRDGSVGVFKPGNPLDLAAKGRPAVSKFAGIAELQPRYEARNVASARLDELLGAGLLVKAEFHEHNGSMGILMEQVQGKSLQKFVEDVEDNTGRKHDFPMALHRDVNRMQLLDAVTGQLDRHDLNVMVETDSAGNYVRLKGIDNDTSFGADPEYNELEDFRNWAYDVDLWNYMGQYQTNIFAAANNSGLPPVADAELAARLRAPGFADKARDSVEGLLTAEETERLGERLHQIRDHLDALERKGMLVTDWASGKTTGGASILNACRRDDIHSQAVAWDLLAPRPRTPRK